MVSGRRGALPVVLARRGSAWGLGLHRSLAVNPQKMEGDERVPAGIFRAGPAFGYDDEFEPALRFPYKLATPKDYFVKDESSADYNTWVRLLENANDPRKRTGNRSKKRCGVRMRFISLKS